MAMGICEHFVDIWRERDLEKGAFFPPYLGPIVSLLSFHCIKCNTPHDILHLYFIIAHSNVGSVCQWQFEKDWTKLLLPIRLRWPSLMLGFLNSKDMATKLSSSREANIRRGTWESPSTHSNHVLECCPFAMSSGGIHVARHAPRRSTECWRSGPGKPAQIVLRVLREWGSKIHNILKLQRVSDWDSIAIKIIKWKCLAAVL